MWDHNFLKLCICLFAAFLNFTSICQSLHEPQSIRTCHLRSTAVHRTQRKMCPRCAQHWQWAAQSSAGSSHTWMATLGKQCVKNELFSLQQGIVSLVQGGLGTVVADAWYQSETLKQGSWGDYSLSLPGHLGLRQHQTFSIDSCEPAF